MGYKTELQSNNADLQTILNKVNALPEAGGGGGSVETCTVTINVDQGNPAINYLNERLENEEIVMEMGQTLTLTVVKNSIIVTSTIVLMWGCSGNIEQLSGSGRISMVVLGDGTVDILDAH